MGCDGEVGDGTPHFWHAQLLRRERGEEVGSDRMQDDGQRNRSGEWRCAVQQRCQEPIRLPFQLHCLGEVLRCSWRKIINAKSA
jgi:hypothetical protein